MLRFALCVLFLFSIKCTKTPCPKSLAIDITSGSRSGSLIIQDDTAFTERNYFIENGTIYGCICNIKKTCIRKCCGPEESLVNKVCTSRGESSLVYRVHNGTEETKSSWNHYVVHNMDCDYERTILNPLFDKSHKYYIQENGSLYSPFFGKQKVRNPEDYCIEVIDDDMFKMNNVTSVVACLRPEDFEKEATVAKSINTYGMIVSMPFLLLTFIAYALLPKRNFHMKALMIYVISLMLGYLLLVINNLSKTTFSDGLCAAMGYFCVLFLLVSFVWMNIICIDISLAFSGYRSIIGKKTAERKKFLMYCGYGFGIPVLHVLVVYLIDSTVALNSVIKPGIGNGECLLARGYPELLYFHGPTAILISINIILFTITAIRIRNVKKETSMLKEEESNRHNYENDKQTFQLYVKLLLAMGINWSMEIISWAVTWAGTAYDTLWILTDFCNAIYGVFIFFIFVFKRSIWNLLKKRYYFVDSNLGESMAMTGTTKNTNYSVTKSSVPESQ